MAMHGMEEGEPELETDYRALIAKIDDAIDETKEVYETEKVSQYTLCSRECYMQTCAPWSQAFVVASVHLQSNMASVASLFVQQLLSQSLLPLALQWLQG